MAHDNQVKVIGWYDNEWGYSCRLVDLIPRLFEEAAVGPRRDVAGKRVLVRADLNVPLDGGASPTTRASARRCRRWSCCSSAVPTRCVSARISAGRRRRRTGEFSMAPVAPPARAARRRAAHGAREHPLRPGETKNDESFARELAEGCDLYVNDAFGSAHRAHASTEAVAHLLPAYAGLLLERELEMLGRLLADDVQHPFVLISGGAKVEDKLGVLERLGSRADTVLVGGKMAESSATRAPLGFENGAPGGRRRGRRLRCGRRGGH